MENKEIVALVASVINAADRPPELRGLTGYIRYPMRECISQVLEDGSLAVKIAKQGYGYKSRYRRAQRVSVNTEAVKKHFNKMLPPSLCVVDVQEQEDSIMIIMREEK